VNKLIFAFSVCLLSSILISACTPIAATRGNLIEKDRVAMIEPGTSKREDVFNALGSPTTVSPFDNSIWYYMGQKTEKKGIFDPDIIEEEIVIVKFDSSNTVSDITIQEGNRIDVPIKGDETPTYGNERTVLQQLFGNLGRFNPDVPE